MGESYASVLDLEKDLKLEEDGSYNLSPSTIFPTLSREDLTGDQVAILDQILSFMSEILSKKLKTKIRTGNSGTKKKRSHTDDPSKMSPPHKNIKA